MTRHLIGLLLILGWATPTWAGNPTHCLTCEEKSMGWRQTLCDDGTGLIQTYNRTLDRWESTVTPPGTARHYSELWRHHPQVRP